MRTLLKTETTQWFEEIGEDGIRRLRMEKETKKYFPKDLDNKYVLACHLKYPKKQK